MPTNNRDELADIYGKIISTFMEGQLRFWGAEAAHSRLSCAYLAFRESPKPSQFEGAYGTTIENLARIDSSSFSAFAYLTNVGHLIYATTLLDTFLSDTTMFLFLVFPESMGKKQQIPIQLLIDAKSRHEALNAATVRRTREVNFLSFAERIQFLRETFGFKITLHSKLLEALQHYPTVRNSAVHDQGIFCLHLNQQGRVVATQKTCPKHPTPVSDKDIRAAVEAYCEIQKIIARDVIMSVFKDNKKLARLMEILESRKRS